MIKKECVLFLDFDGVLHFFFPEENSTDEENQFFYFIPQFERFIRAFSDRVNFKIVISSTWRDNKTFNQLKAPFSKDIQEMIVGVTPNHYDNSEGSRLREAQEWLMVNQYNGSWIAIDDNANIWYNAPELFLCENGLNQSVIDDFIARFDLLRS
jgi:hypothetical protein